MGTNHENWTLLFAFYFRPQSSLPPSNHQQQHSGRKWLCHKFTIFISSKCYILHNEKYYTDFRLYPFRPNDPFIAAALWWWSFMVIGTAFISHTDCPLPSVPSLRHYRTAWDINWSLLDPRLSNATICLLFLQRHRAESATTDDVHQHRLHRHRIKRLNLLKQWLLWASKLSTLCTTGKRPGGEDLLSSDGMMVDAS